MSLFYFLIYVYLLLRPYYLFSSGNIQISDIFLLIAFAIFILLSRKEENILHKNIKKNKKYLLFLICVIVINSIYAIIYRKLDFLISTLYYIFNFIIIIIFSYLINNKKFLLNMNKIIKINMIIQFLLCILGLGQNWAGTYRYMGTFNDPNQFAYYIFISYCYIYIFKKKFSLQTSLIPYLIISLYLIIESSSTGMLLGITVFIILELFSTMKKLPEFIKKNKKNIFFTIYSLFVVFTIYETISLINPNKDDFKNLNSRENKILERTKEKLNKASNKEESSLWHDRGYDMIFAYPHYILYGAGQGKYIRFYEKTGNKVEVHATFPSILFYYGIVPLIILLYWIYNKLKYVPSYVLIVYIALFIESFTLLNQRQSLFWIIIILGSIYTKKENIQNETS